MNRLTSIACHLSPVFAALRNHRHAFIIVALLTLVMTYPTIYYVFKTDLRWLPHGNSNDVFINLWNTWYVEKIFAGQAELLYTNLMFYPEGVSLLYQPFIFPHVAMVNGLSLFLPLTNAYSLAYLVIICSAALSAYVYLLWLVKDKWIALFGAVVFGLSPYVTGYPNLPSFTFIAPIPLLLYCIHRGICERRPLLIVAAGLLTGATSLIVMYVYVTVLTLLGAFAFGLALSRWRDRNFWLLSLLLAATIAASSWWQVYPMIKNRPALEQAVAWHGEREVKTDLVSFFFNHDNPLTGRLPGAIIQLTGGGAIGKTFSYLGYLPLLLCGFGLANPFTRRKTLPWAFLCAGFLLLSMGSFLTIGGREFPDILLPKYYLNQMLPAIFGAFSVPHVFIIGALLPFAALSCFGLIALQRRLSSAAKPFFILTLLLVVAVEYYTPVQGNLIPFKRTSYLDWLTLDQTSDDIRLINLPMGRENSKVYNYFQALSGFPHAEGAISRTPDSALDYIKANPVLSVWNNLQSTNCVIHNQDDYLAGIRQLVDDGFSHIVHHRGRYHWERYIESFRYVDPAYSDDYVWVYRISDLRDSCPSDFLERHPIARAYVDALRQASAIDSRQGKIVLFPPSPEQGDHIRKYVRHFAPIDREVVTVASDDRGSVVVRTSDNPDSDAGYKLESDAAVWMISNVAQFNAEQNAAYQAWFASRFRFCARFKEDESRSIDLLSALIFLVPPSTTAAPLKSTMTTAFVCIMLRSRSTQIRSGSTWPGRIIPTKNTPSRSSSLTMQATRRFSTTMSSGAIF